MDTSRQVYELEATGWRRGLYDDIQHTFRAPIVNWIFRTAVANLPEFTRYAWGQVKPLFGTRQFAAFSVEYRDTVLAAMEEEGGSLPTLRKPDTGLLPAEYAALHGQVATFDVVAPRLAVLFETVDRALHDEPVGTDPPDERTTTAPLPQDLDRDRGLPPTMADDVPDGVADTVGEIRAFHGFGGDDLPSIYRCLLQWPGYLEPAWDALEPRLEGAGFEAACERSSELVESFVDRAPYRPALGQGALEAAGVGDAGEDARELFRSFNSGPVETVLPALPVWASTVGAEGERSLRSGGRSAVDR
ncbi:hypothetical protein BRC93_12810 [Halobacteriales archaeon QS_5_70_15]|nr:MAG: hypothetical protein BRC93_12810 [Halobacteriales archaeon QS_5_70_15]